MRKLSLQLPLGHSNPKVAWGMLPKPAQVQGLVGFELCFTHHHPQVQLGFPPLGLLNCNCISDLLTQPWPVISLPHVQWSVVSPQMSQSNPNLGNLLGLKAEGDGNQPGTAGEPTQYLSTAVRALVQEKLSEPWKMYLRR